jgi:hypothetical protein
MELQRVKSRRRGLREVLERESSRNRSDPGAGEAARGALYIQPQRAGYFWGRENKHCPSGGGLHLPLYS